MKHYCSSVKYKKTSLDFSANLNKAKHTPQIRPETAVTHIKRKNLPAFETNTLVGLYVKNDFVFVFKTKET